MSKKNIQDFIPKYDVYNIEYYDESIEESNSYAQTLSKEYARKICDEEDTAYIGEIIKLDIETILRYTWAKEDIDSFLQNQGNPLLCYEEWYTEECDDNYRYDRVKYVPKNIIRDNTINEILNNENSK